MVNVSMARRTQSVHSAVHRGHGVTPATSLPFPGFGRTRGHGPGSDGARHARDARRRRSRALSVVRRRHVLPEQQHRSEPVGGPVVSVVELREHSDRGDDFDGGYGSGPDRTPPQDVAAEQSVLGAMLLSKDAIADVVETIRETDFYRPAHASVFAAILDLYGRGEPADAVTVVGELTRTGEIGRGRRRAVPAHPRRQRAHRRERRLLRPHRARAGDPAAPRRGGHPHRPARLRRRGRRRRRSSTGRRPPSTTSPSKRTSEDYLPLREIMPGTLEEIEAIASRGGKMTGVPTGFARPRCASSTACTPAR